MVTQEKLTGLSWGEKREERFKKWILPNGVEFDSEVAKQAYRAKVTRLIDAIKLREPDRVPCILPAGVFPAHYAGITPGTAMYDYREMKRAWLKYLHDFDGDTFPGPGVGSARVSKIIDSKTSR